MYLWIGGTRHVGEGVRGTGVVTINAQGIPVIRWTLTGLWSTPSEQSRPTPVFTAWQKPKVATSANTPTFTVNDVSLVLRSFQLDLRCQVEPRLLIGRDEIKIVNREELIQATVEAVPLSTLDPFTLAQPPATLVETEIVHGTTAGRIVTITAPTCQVLRMSGYENSQDVLEWPLRLKPLPTDGNDQFEMVLS